MKTKATKEFKKYYEKYRDIRLNRGGANMSAQKQAMRLLELAERWLEEIVEYEEIDKPWYEKKPNWDQMRKQQEKIERELRRWLELE